MKKGFVIILSILFVIGLIAFIAGLAGEHPERAWQAYLINFLLWSGIAQGGLLFSTVMHTVKAKWSGPLSRLSESFAAFFPVSLVLFLILFLGKNHIFTWLHHDLHGKEVWLNLPFLFSRNLAGILILYGLGFAYLYYSNKIGRLNLKSDSHRVIDLDICQKRMTVFGILYIVAFTLVLSLIGYDLVMAMDPHWYSTLFGAYTFVKAFYVGLGGLIILASILHIRHGPLSVLKPSHFHDVGKLFFAFCLMWADFFYVQFVVIWYGNISEETNYVIQRTMTDPWKNLAWAVFIIAFVVPFIILLNRKVKAHPVPMIVLSGLILFGMWLEHLLLIGPAIFHDTTTLPVGITDGLITLAFLALMVFSISIFMQRFPEIYSIKNQATKDVNT